MGRWGRGKGSVPPLPALSTTLGERIKAYLQSQADARGLSRPLSLSQVAKRAGLNPQLMYRMDREKDWSTDTVRRLAMVLGCTTDYLLGMDELRAHHTRQTREAPCNSDQ